MQVIAIDFDCLRNIVQTFYSFFKSKYSILVVKTEFWLTYMLILEFLVELTACPSSMSIIYHRMILKWHCEHFAYRPYLNNILDAINRKNIVDFSPSCNQSLTCLGCLQCVRLHSRDSVGLVYVFVPGYPKARFGPNTCHLISSSDEISQSMSTLQRFDNGKHLREFLFWISYSRSWQRHPVHLAILRCCDTMLAAILDSALTNPLK